MRSMHPTLPLVVSTLLTIILTLYARPSFIDARQFLGTDLNGATLSTCSIYSSVIGDSGSMIMSSTVYKGNNEGEKLATLSTTFPDHFTTPNICWPSDDQNQPPFYLKSGLVEYGVIVKMCTPGSSGGRTPGFSYTYAGQSGSVAFHDEAQIGAGLFQTTNTAYEYIFHCWIWDNPGK